MRRTQIYGEFVCAASLACRVFCRSRTGEYVFNGMIAFMTCVFEYWAVTLYPRCLDSPRLRVSHWIVDREFVYHCVCGCPGESLDDAGFVANAPGLTKGAAARLHFRLIVTAH